MSEATIAAARKPPKHVKSLRVCPACGSRATKLFHLNSGNYHCQVCDHEYPGQLPAEIQWALS